MPAVPSQRPKMDDLNLPAQIPIDENYVDTREQDLDDADSALSIASSKYNFIWEHGRLYHDYRSGHIFPQDEAAQQNEKFFHMMMLCILDNHHFVAPVDGKNLKNVLDVATGLGLWPENVADAYPNCHIIGLDTLPNPTCIPNLTFQVTNITEDWVFDRLDTKFDLVHLRNLFATLSNDEWPKLYQQCFDFMGSGAWIEQIEVEIIAHCDDNTKKPDSEIFRLADLATDLGRVTNRDFRIAERMADMIRAAGFVDVKERSYKLPLGGWSADPKYKAIGSFYEVFYKTGLQGWLMAALTRGFDWTQEQVDELCASALEEIDSRKHHYYFYLRTVAARKP